MHIQNGSLAIIESENGWRSRLPLQPMVSIGGAVHKPDLTPREKQIVSLVSEAKLNKEIAYELNLTEGTVKVYLTKIYMKVEVKNRTELAIWAVRNPEQAS